MTLLRRDPIKVYLHQQQAPNGNEPIEIAGKGVGELWRLEHGPATDGWQSLRHGRRFGIFSPRLNELLTSHDLPVKALGHPYRIPDAVRPYAGAVLRDRASRHTIYNGAKLRLVNDLTSELLEQGAELTLQPTDFFSTLCTNDIAACELRRQGKFVYGGGDLLGRDRQLHDLATSPCSNHVGVSALAITADERLVILQQAPEAATYGGLLMPSGSAALDPFDLTAGATLQAVLREATRRIVAEESGVEREEIGETGLIGYMRQLDRGGKPEFFGLCYLRVPFSKVSHRGDPEAFIAGAEIVGAKLSELSEVLEVFRGAREDQFSFSLYAALAFLDRHLLSR